MSPVEPRTTVLVVDDEPGICTALDRYLEDEGHRCLTAASAEEALRLLASNHPDVALIDYRLPGMDGLTLLKRMRELQPSMEIVLITAFGGVDTAIRATQDGAYAYLPKPLDLDEVGALVQRMVTRPTVVVRSGPDRVNAPWELALQGCSTASRELVRQLEESVRDPAPLLCVGEVGSGREAVARALHARVARVGEFRVVHCAGRTAAELESQTEALAERNGFPYLAEAGEMGDEQLELLLTAVSGASRRPRLAASLSGAAGPETDRQVARAVELGWRMIELPALRDRADDLESLIAGYLGRIRTETGRAVRGVDAEGLKRLRAHTWPGNLRELENVLRAAVLVARDDVVTVDALPVATGVESEPHE